MMNSIKTKLYLKRNLLLAAVLLTMTASAFSMGRKPDEADTDDTTVGTEEDQRRTTPMPEDNSPTTAPSDGRSTTIPPSPTGVEPASPDDRNESAPRGGADSDSMGGSGTR